MPSLSANATCASCGTRVHLVRLADDPRRIRLNLRSVRRGAIILSSDDKARYVGPTEAGATVTYEPHAFTCKVRDQPDQDGRQSTLLDLAAAQAGKVDGMTRAEVHADEEWKDLAVRTVHTLAEARPDVISDHIWAAGVPKPSEPRALGPVMEEAAKRGWIERTDRVVASTQPTRHGGPVIVWRSLIYRP